MASYRAEKDNNTVSSDIEALTPTKRRPAVTSQASSSPQNAAEQPTPQRKKKPTPIKQALNEKSSSPRGRRSLDVKAAELDVKLCNGATLTSTATTDDDDDITDDYDTEGAAGDDSAKLPASKASPNKTSPSKTSPSKTSPSKTSPSKTSPRKVC